MLVLFPVAFPILPLVFAWYCWYMKRDLPELSPGAYFFLVVAYFFIFGTLGGWILAFAFAPEPLFFVFVLAMVTLAPIVLMGSSIALLFVKNRSAYHSTAMFLGFGYSLLLVLCYYFPSIGVLIGKFADACIHLVSIFF